MKVLHLTDVHHDFGGVDLRYLGKKDVDVIAVTGDIANGIYDIERFFESLEVSNAEKFYVPGNHDLWSVAGDENDLFAVARKSGFKTPEPGKDWTVVDNVLLFNVYYYWERDWKVEVGDGNDVRGHNPYDINRTVDHRFYEIGPRIRDGLSVVDKPSQVRFSLSHMSPTDRIKSWYKPSLMYVNNDIFHVLKQYSSPVHFYGHTHEPVETMIDGVRLVNSTFRDDRMDILEASTHVIEV